MKKYTLLFLLLVATLDVVRAQNLLSNGGFESYTAGFSGYMTTGNGNATGLPGQWQLAFVGNNYPTCSGASCGTTQADNSTQNSGNNSLQINITKHTNRNDIRLFQSIATPPVGNNFVVTVYLKSDANNYPLTVNVFKSTEAINSNGSCNASSPCQTFNTTTRWRQYKMYVDLSSWSVAERTNMRISIRPNTSTAVPAGPYPKIFWFDDISFKVVDTLSELKDIAIQVATERKYLATDSGYNAEASALQSEIITLMGSTPGYPVVPVKAIGFNPVPLQTTAGNNPFIAAIHTWAASYLAQSFTGYGKATTTNFVFPGSVDARTLGTVTENLYWLLVSPLSSYRYHPELFRRLLTIIYATSDDYKMNGQNDVDATPGSTTNALNDWFAAPKACYSWRMAEYSFNDFIPATLKQRFKDATDSMGKHFYNFAYANFTALPSSTISINYANRDVSYAEILMQAGLHRTNNTWINFSKRMVDSMNLVNRYADGAYSYIELQNETTNYHGGNNNSLAKIWAISEYQPAWDCVSKTAMFELMSVEPREVPEFYTAPAWKTMWNGSSGISAEPLLSISQNPYLKTRYNQFRVVNGFDDEMTLSLAFYNPNIPSLPLADSYLVYDRNIKGLRGRYGRFSYGATGRNVARTGSNDCGLQTVVGAMETIPGRTANIDEMDAALMAVHSKVHVRKSGTPTEWTDWGYMMSRADAKVCVGKTASTISTPGVLQYQTSGPNAFETSWSSYQQWITLPDRIIGFVETYPTNNVATQAYEIDGRVRFTYGRQTTSLLNPKYMITEVAGSRYAYGKFKTIIHGHDFTTVSVDTAGVVRDEFRNSMEIIFRYNLSNGTSLYSYPANTRKYFMVEIRDSMAVGNATVSRVINGNVKGLVVKLNGKSYASYRNNGPAASVDLSNVLIGGNTNQVLFSRGDSIVKLPILIAGTSYTIPANEQVLIISTDTPAADTGRGWQNYPELLSYDPNLLLPISLKSFDAAVKNCNAQLSWSTANETGFDKFELQKSIDGASYFTVATIQSKCLGTNICNYATSVSQPEPKAFYRLKMLDKNGLFSFSKSVGHNNACAQKNKLLLYPNPLTNNQDITVKYLSEQASDKAFIMLYDAAGRELIRKHVIISNGVNQTDIPSANYKNGNYSVKLEVPGFSISQKLVISKQ